MTNREWLESLSDEELAKFLLVSIHCHYCIWNGDFCLDTCEIGKLKWLQAEHKDEG